MKLVLNNNLNHEECLTIGKEYDVKIELLEKGKLKYHFLDDNNRPLTTVINRFKLNNKFELIEGILEWNILDLKRNQQPYIMIDSNYTEYQDKIEYLQHLINQIKSINLE